MSEKMPEWVKKRIDFLHHNLEFEYGKKYNHDMIEKAVTWIYNELAPRLKSAEKLREALEFYAAGAGIEVVDEGRNYNSRHVAYENDYSENGHMDKPVGFKAKEALEEYDKAKGE